MILHIKNMVCNRCLLVVKQEMEKLGLKPVSIALGKVETERELSQEEKHFFSARLLELGFELMEDKNAIIIEQIKALLITLVNQPEKLETTHLSDYIGKALYRDYSGLSKLFSSVEGVTIEQYFILQKIEKAKELLVYAEKSITEIAFDLGYSSVAHLSRQFSKITGMSPAAFRKMRDPERISIDQI